MATYYWRGGNGTWNNASNTNWSLTSGGAGGAGIPGISDDVIFDVNSDLGAGFTVTIGTNAFCRDMTVSGLDQTMTLSGSSNLNCYRNFTLPATGFVTSSYTGTLVLGQGAASGTITTNGAVLNCNVSIGGSRALFTMGSAFTVSSAFTVTLTLIDLDFSSFTFTAGAVICNSNGKSILFGTSHVVVTGNNRTVLDLNTGSPTCSGTPRISSTYTGAVGTRTIALPSSTAVAIGLITGTATSNTISIGTGSDTIIFGGRFSGFNTTGFNGTTTLAGSSFNTTFVGSVILGAATTVPALSGNLSFSTLLANSSMGLNGKTIDPGTGGVFFGSGATFTYTLTSAATFAGTIGFDSGRIDTAGFTFTAATATFASSTFEILGTGNAVFATPTMSGAGALTISSSTVTTPGTFAHSGGALTFNGTGQLNAAAMTQAGVTARSIVNNGTGIIRLTGSGTIATLTNVCTVSGAGVLDFRIDNNTATAATFTNGMSGNRVDVDIVSGTYTLTFSGGQLNSVNCTGFSGSIIWNGGTVFGSLVLASGMTSVGGTGLMFIAPLASTTVPVTTFGKPITCQTRLGSNATGTVQFLDTFTATVGAASTLAGTIDINGQTVSIGAIAGQTSSATIINGTLNTGAVTQTAATMTISAGAGLTSSGAYTLNGATIVLNGTLTCASFVATTGTRALNFGAGQITLTGNATTILTLNYTSLTLIGTPRIVSNYTGAVGTRTFNLTNQTAATPIDFTTTETTGIIVSSSATDTISFTGSVFVGVFNLTGFAGTVTHQAASLLAITGNFTLGAGTTLTAGTVALFFTPQTGVTQSVNTAGKTFDFPIGFQGAGTGTTRLVSSFTVAPARATTIFSSSNIDINSQTTSFGAVTANATSTTSISNGTLSCVSFTSNNILTINSGAVIQTTTGLFTHAAGTINLNGTAPISCFRFSYTAGTINFGTSRIDVTGNSSTVWFGNPTFTGTFYVTLSYTGSVGTRTVSAGLARSVYTSGTSEFVVSAAATDTLSMSGSINDVVIPGFSGTVGLAGVGMYGNLELPLNTPTVSSTSTLAFLATSAKTISTNGSVLNFPVTFNSTTGSWTLQTAVTMLSSRPLSVSAGTLSLNGYTFSCGQFTCAGASTRSIAFGGGNITVTGSGTFFTATTIANLTLTGTPTVNIANNSATASTINIDNTSTEAKSFDINFTTGTYALTLTSLFCRNLSFSGFSGVYPNQNATVFGGLALSPTMTYAAGTATITMSGVVGPYNLAGNGGSLGRALTFNAVGGSWQLVDAFSVAVDQTTTINNGTLNLNGFDFTTGRFSLSAGTKAISFGSNKIRLSTTTTSAPLVVTYTGFTYTGTPAVQVIGGGAAQTLTLTGSTGATAANTLDVEVLATAGTVTPTGLAVRNLTLNGAFTLGNGTATIFGNYTYTAATALTAGTSAWTFAATSGTQLLNFGAATHDFPLTFNGAGGTRQFASSLAQGATRAFTLTSGTVDFGGFAAGTGVLTILTPGATIANGTLNSASVTHTSGTLTIPSTVTFTSAGTYTFTAGALDFSAATTPTVRSFSSSNANVRSLAFGASPLTLTGNSATVWDTGTLTNFTYTGTFNVASNYSGAVGTRTFTLGSWTEAAALNFGGTGASGFTVGSGGATDTVALTGNVNNLDWTGFSGTWGSSTQSVYGNLVCSAGLTIAFPTTNFISTTAGKTITSAGKTLNTVTFNGVGGGWSLLDALSCNGFFTLTNGSFASNNYSMSVLGFASSNSNARTANLGSSSLTITGSGATAFTLALEVNLTWTSTGVISMTSASAKSFQGGFQSFGTLRNAGAGALTVTGSNTFTTIDNTVQPTAFVFPSNIVQTVTNFNVNGTPGNLVTITSSILGAQAILSKASGAVTVSNVSLRDSNATGGATWLALISNGNVDVSNNTGWIFIGASSNFFAFF